jgi:hypothetical protein
MGDNYGVSERQPFVDDQKRITRPWLGVLQRALRKSQSVTSGDGAEAAALLAVLGQTSRPGTRRGSIADTHANRGNYPALAFPDARYYETDRSYTYLSTGGQWIYAGGTMVGAVADRPGDLGSNDTGAVFNSTDSLDYRWDGAAWGALDTVRGGGALTHVGRLTKVSAAGVIGESSLTDDGSKVSGTEPLHLDAGATPANAQLALRANLLGSLSLLCYAADNVQIGLDLEEIGGVNTCANAVVARILKNNGLLYFQGAAGQTVGTGVGTGGNPAIASYMIIDLSTGFVGFGGNVTPAYAVDATGDANVSGVYRVDGTQVVGARRTGWGAPTATLDRSALANGDTAVKVLQTLAALITDLRATGVIGN